MIRRIFLIVLDSVGAGEAPDAVSFGDEGASTLGSLSRSPALSIPTLRRMGLGNIDGLSFLGPVSSPSTAYARLTEASLGKDTTIGHWELAGHVSPSPLPTFPQGFPEEFLESFSRAVGRGVLCNRPYSGTKVIADFGEEHLRTGKLIVYTSADSVFQIAAHTSVLSTEELYEICRIARKMLVGELGVGRVIARPFAGEAPNFYRTDDRRDFSLSPPEGLLPERLAKAGLDVISVGKISDIFAHVGITKAIPTHSNKEGMEAVTRLLSEDFHGLCFVNLVDFDMLYGHRRDMDGYAAALSRFDEWLEGVLPLLGEDDLLMITADHGCDPAFTRSTDHTREFVPLLIWGDKISPQNLGTRPTFADVGATVASLLGVAPEGCDGTPLF